MSSIVPLFIEGMGFSLAEAGVLVEEFGTAGALVVASFMSATEIGNDSEKLMEALNTYSLQKEESEVNELPMDVNESNKANYGSKIQISDQKMEQTC